MDLQQKIIDCFIGKVVRKDLAFLVKGGLPVPTYVLEYLLGQYCASDDEEVITEGIEKVKQVIQNNYVHRAEAESVKGLIRESGKHRIIDKVTVVLNEKNDEYQATFANLGLSGVPIGTDYVRHNPKLLSGNGVWCIITLGYISGENIKVRWEIQTLKPIQISNIDLQDYIDQRKNFATDEWIDFLIHTVGLNPETMNRREKFITLARLLPHVENNFNFMELGPKGTGKSHVFQELSPYGVLVSGGDVTSARLLVTRRFLDLWVIGMLWHGMNLSSRRGVAWTLCLSIPCRTILPTSRSIVVRVHMRQVHRCLLWAILSILCHTC